MTYQNLIRSAMTAHQREPIAGREAEMKRNNAGGYTFTVDPLERLRRFVILGSDGPTYYATARDHTKQNLQGIIDAWQNDPQGAAQLIAAISHAGRAPKNDPALVALAVGIASGGEARKAALGVFNVAVRIPTHLFNFLNYYKALGGTWSRSVRREVAAFYQRDLNDVAYHVAKYRQRNGWTHGDVIRQAHPKPPSSQHAELYYYAINGWDGVGNSPHPVKGLDLLWAFERAKESDKKELIRLIQNYPLSWEMLPSNALTSKEIWQALLDNRRVPLGALLRNLGRLTQIELIEPMGAANRGIVERLTDQEALKRARLHPLNILIAQRAYASGGGRSGASWKPVTAIVDALAEAFYLAFGAIEPTGKNRLVALDVSGSMGGFYGQASKELERNMGGLTPRELSAVMAMVTLRTEPNMHIVGFSHKLIDLPLRKSMSLTEVVRVISGIPYGATDCALPALEAIRRGWQVDGFEIYTDNETWFGNVHPTRALQMYREASGRDATLAAVAMTATEYTIADPTDPKQINVVGFDTATPNLIGDLVAGRL